MKQPLTLKTCRALKRDSSATGFTVIETLVAGLIIAAVMTAVGRLSVAGMAASQNQSSRNTIEAAINDHIQLLQMQDSYLTQEAIVSTAGLNSSLETACAAPSTFLKEHLIKPEIAGVVQHPAVELEWNADNPYLLVITHSFEAPETSIGSEKRITELSPNFSSQCYDLQ